VTKKQFNPEAKVRSFQSLLNSKIPMFSCLEVYGQAHSPQLLELKQQFEKKTRRKTTLVFEMVGTMI
jgi:hypothetical protein